MRRIEGRPVYSKTYRGNEGSTFVPGQSLEYPCVLVLNAIGIIVVLTLLPALEYRLGGIVFGTTIGWLLASLWMIYREGWKTHLHREHLLVDKSAQELQRVYIYRSGEQITHRYTRDQVHALIPKNELNRYAIILDATSPVIGRSRRTLVSFPTAAERDALLHELAAALQLPIVPEE